MPAEKEVTFDENGNTLSETITEAPEPDADAPEESPETPEPAAAAAAAEGSGKYRIGNRRFDTQEAALEYANQTAEAGTSAADAYRQGVQEALAMRQAADPGVTPAPKRFTEGLNIEELYTNADGFLEKYAAKIQDTTRAEVLRQQDDRDQSNQIWNSFTSRHPQLADFRTEVENVASFHAKQLRAITASKGQDAGFDYIATHLRSKFDRYANAIKPGRELANTKQTTPAASKASGVTPANAGKKQLSFSEQLRSIRKRG